MRGGCADQTDISPSGGRFDLGVSADPIDLDFSPDERLFGMAGTDWRATAALAGTTTDVVPYASGFREAGDMLIIQGIEAGVQDFIAFPAFYCYRHALELTLKDVVYEFERARSGDFTVIRTHDLDAIWRRARTALEATWPDGDAVQLERMGRVVEELAAADPSGEQFRYDRDREGFVRDIPEELMRVDLQIVKTVMGKMIVLMQGAADGISERRAFEG